MTYCPFCHQVIGTTRFGVRLPRLKAEIVDRQSRRRYRHQFDRTRHFRFVPRSTLGSARDDQGSRGSDQRSVDQYRLAHRKRLPTVVPSPEKTTMTGRASRDKGNRTERAIVRLLQERGLAGERVPLSGAALGRFGGDISVPALGRDLRGEAKCRGNGFNRLYDWLEGRDFLVLRADRKPLLVVATLELATQIVAMAERAKRSAP
jgi:hypothetical protein